MDEDEYKRIYDTIDERLTPIPGSWTSPTNELLTAAQMAFHTRQIETYIPTENPDALYAHYQGNAATTLLFVLPLSTNKTLLPLHITLAALDACQQATQIKLPTLKWWLLPARRADTSRLDTVFMSYKETSRADGCLWHIDEHIDKSTNTVSTSELFLGCKGRMQIELAVQMDQGELASTYGTITPNAAWRLVWVLNKLKTSREEVLLPGFYDGLTPIEDELLEPLHGLTEPSIQPLSNLSGFRLHYVRFLTPTCTLLAIETDTRGVASHLPQSARAYIEFHLVPGQVPGVLFQTLRQYLEKQGFADVTVRLLDSYAASYSQPNEPFVQAVRKAFAPSSLLPMSDGSYAASVLNMPVMFTNLAPQEQGAVIAQYIKHVAALILNW
jgi:hypothetical protein